MIPKLLSAWCVVAVCVAIHAAGVASALRWLRHQPLTRQGFWPWTWLFIQLAGWMILFHLLQVSIWALLYFGGNAIPDLASAFYFSAVTYTTTGYGDVTLPETWRLVGGVEALTGILMCGWSTGFFFAVVSRIYVSSAPHRKHPIP